MSGRPHLQAIFVTVRRRCDVVGNELGPEVSSEVNVKPRSR
jgi:hypothetical protein